MALLNHRVMLIRSFLFGAFFTVFGLLGLILGWEQRNGGGWFLLVGGVAVCSASIWQLKSTK